MSYRHLYRSVNNRRIAGVAGGLAEYFGLDPTPIRLLWLLAVFLGGSGVLVYLIAWIVIPEAPYSEINESQPAANESEPANHESAYTEPSTWNKSNGDQPRKGLMYVGIILILLGGIFLVRELVPWYISRFSWAILLIALGVLLLLPRRRGAK